MSAYFIVDIDIHDVPGIEEYRQQVPATIAKYGGRIIVRGGKFETLEGSWSLLSTRAPRLAADHPVRVTP